MPRQAGGTEGERRDPESSPGTDSGERGKENMCGVRKNPGRGPAGHAGLSPKQHLSASHKLQAK